VPPARNLVLPRGVYGLQCRHMPEIYLGEFEQIVLLAILRLGDDAYAIPVREEIEARTGRTVSRGALYTALERLEAKKCLRSSMSEPLPERGGRSRRYYAVTPAGLAALRATREALMALWHGVESQLERK
jgi:PadR family transcriptional regulator PadR